MEKRNSGAALVEIVVAIAIFIIISSGSVMVALGSVNAGRGAEERLQAVALAQEGLEAARAVRDYDWDQLADGTHGISDASQYWQLTASPDTVGRFTRSVTVSQAPTGAAKDVSVDVSWDFAPGVSRSVSATTRLWNWLFKYWVQTLETEFSAGEKTDTTVTNNSGGEVALRSLPDFTGSSLFATLDINGSGDILDLYVSGNTIYLALKNEGTKPDFLAYDISNIDSAQITQIAAVELNTDVNKLVISGNYAYLATNDNSREVIIIRLSDYTVVNSIDIPTASDAEGIAIQNNTLYVTTTKSSSQEFYAYDIQNPEQPIVNPVSSIELSDSGNDLSIQGNYAFVANTSDTQELQVVRLSPPALVKTLDLSGNGDGSVVRISPSGTTAYVGTRNSSGGEFYGINISNPTVSLPILGSTEIGDDATDIALSGGTAFVSTHAGGDKEVVLINTSTYGISKKIDLEGGPVAYALWISGKYLYIGTNNDKKTLQVIRAEGNSGGSPSYPTSGIFTSGSFDTGSSSTAYGKLSWTSSGSGSAKFQLRTAADAAGLASAAWAGPDGTSSTYYLLPNTQITLAPGAQPRFIQYQATLQGNGSSTPLLEDVTVNYAN